MQAGDGLPVDGAAACTWQERGYPRSISWEDCNVLQKVTHTWGAPLLQRGRKGQFDVRDALPLLSERDRVGSLVRSFERCYDRAKERTDANRARTKDGLLQNGFLWAILRCHASEALLHSFWTALESACRLLSPFALRQLVRWLQRYNADSQAVQQGEGWLWASLVVVFGVGLALCHHQLFWVGMRMGFGMKQQVRPCVRCH
jgi:hypothetical protein